MKKAEEEEELIHTPNRVDVEAERESMFARCAPCVYGFDFGSHSTAQPIPHHTETSSQAFREVSVSDGVLFFLLVASSPI